MRVDCSEWTSIVRRWFHVQLRELLLTVLHKLRLFWITVVLPIVIKFPLIGTVNASNSIKFFVMNADVRYNKGIWWKTHASKMLFTLLKKTYVYFIRRDTVGQNTFYTYCLQKPKSQKSVYRIKSYVCVVTFLFARI